MRKAPILNLIFLTVLITACRTQTTQTLPEPVSATESVTQPTQLPTSTTAPVVSDTTIPLVTEATTETSTSSVSFINDIMPIFENSCNKCHGVEQIKEGLDMRTYETLMVGSFNGTVITPGNANDSFLVQQLLEGEMPKRGTKLTLEQIQIIIDWVNAGALNN